jgi:hypothetical protein
MPNTALSNWTLSGITLSGLPIKAIVVKLTFFKNYFWRNPIKNFIFFNYILIQLIQWNAIPEFLSLPSETQSSYLKSNGTSAVALITAHLELCSNGFEQLKVAAQINFYLCSNYLMQLHFI